MRKLGYILYGVFGLALVSCGPKTQETILKTGVVNQPVQLEVTPDNRQADYMLEWTFTKLPPRVVLTKYDFQPVQTSPEVSFVPPDTGTYRLEYILRNQRGVEKVVQPFTVRVGTVDQAARRPSATPDESAPAETSGPAGRNAQPTSAGSPTSGGAASRSGQSPAGRSSSEIMANPRRTHRYTVQIASLKSFSRAEAVANQAKKLGYDSYVQRATLPNTGEIWYRVRIGSFNTHQAAETLLKKLKQVPAFSGNSMWIDFQREDS